VGKLRDFFARRGVALSAVAIASALSASAVQAAPAGLAATISATAVQGSAATASIIALVKGALKLMTYAKLKVATALSAAVVTVTATAVAIEKLATQSGTETAVVVQADNAQTDAQPNLAQAQSSAAVNTTSDATGTFRDRIIVQKTTGPANANTSDWLNIDSRTLATLPPDFFIRPTEFPAQSPAMVSSASSLNGQKLWGRAIPMKMLITAAYGVPPSRIQFSVPEPEQKFDVIMTVPDGSKQMLQDEIRKQFGLVAKPEMQDTEVLDVKVTNSDAPGLKPSSQPDPTVGGGGGGGFGGGATSSSSRVIVRSEQQSGGGGGTRRASRIGGNDFKVENGTIDGLLNNLQSHFDKTLYNATGLTGRYDINLSWNPSNAAPNALETAMLEQLGLELSPGRAQVEMLVVQKAD
jgi:uncharacterized protein (TIGR03435 family)